MGPFDEIPSTQCHISPLMSRPKEGTKGRIILDLSFGDSDSVNGITKRVSYDGWNYT